MLLASQEVSQDNSMELLKERNFFPQDTRILPEPLTLSTEVAQSTPDGPTSTFWKQATLLLFREWINLKRAPANFITNVVAAAILTVVSSILLFRLGSSNKATEGVVAGIFGSLINMFLQSLLLTSANIISSFAFERPLFLKEYTTKHYAVLPYLGSKFIFDTLQTFFICVIMCLIAYYMVQYEMSFFIFLAITLVVTFSGTAMSTLLGAACSDPTAAASLLGLSIMPQFYFAGLLVAVTLMPVWIRWLQYICVLRYASALATVYEFASCAPGAAEEQCAAFMAVQGVSVGSRWWYWLAAWSLIGATRVLSYILLRKAARNYS